MSKENYLTIDIIFKKAEKIKGREMLLWQNDTDDLGTEATKQMIIKRDVKDIEITYLTSENYHGFIKLRKGIEVYSQDITIKANLSANGSTELQFGTSENGNQIILHEVSNKHSKTALLEEIKKFISKFY